MFGECDMEIFAPLRTDASYSVRGEITDVKRKQGASIGVIDLVTFRLEIVEGDGCLAGACTNSFVFPRHSAS